MPKVGDAGEISGGDIIGGDDGGKIGGEAGDKIGGETGGDTGGTSIAVFTFGGIAGVRLCGCR